MFPFLAAPPPPVYVQVPGIVLQVAPQPGNYASPFDDFLVRFDPAPALGFIAHDTLAGRHFFDLRVGQLIVAIYKGYRRYYQVDHLDRYQALQGNNPYSDYIDLATNQRLTADAVFQREYGDPDTLVLQTSVRKGGNPVWGRLFVSAKQTRPEVMRGNN